MTTSQATPFLSDVLGGEQIPIGKLAYFRARLSNHIHELVLAEFFRLERGGKINKASLARRIGRKPEQVTRWLGAAGNWTIDTFSALMLGMGCEPALSISHLDKANKLSDAINGLQIASLNRLEKENIERQSLGGLSTIEIAPVKSQNDSLSPSALGARDRMLGISPYRQAA